MDFTIHTEQKQTLSYKMIQASSLLQMTAIQLEHYLNEQTMENPVLELTVIPPTYIPYCPSETYQWISSHDEQNRYLYQQMEAYEKEFPEWNLAAPLPETLSDHLWSQLLTLDWPFEQEDALRFLLDSLDEKGYFSDSLEQFATRFHLNLSEAEQLLFLVQSLEPSGIGARNLEECLCIQLEHLGELTTELKRFLHSNLPLIAKNQLAVISRKEKLPLTKVKAFCEQIKKLNPKPGAIFETSVKPDYITPDIIAKTSQEHITLLLNDAIYPEIELNSYYMQLFRETTDREVQDYLQQKVRQAQWLQQCIRQRNSTLLSVAQAILTMQQEFFLLGPNYLRPLKQADIAAYLDIHVSTVSRACHGKYLQCSWGSFPLTSFFVKTISSKDKSNSNTPPETSLHIQKALIELINNENKSKPYSDRILAELLASQGFSISRRTVAKYREALSIPGTTGRKKY